VRSSEGPEGGKASRPARVAAAVRRAVADGARAAERLLERHRRRPLIDLGLRIYERDRDMAGTVVGSAVAFRLFLFFVPLLLFVAGVVGFLGAYVDTGDVSEAGISGGLASQIGTALSQPESTRWAAVGIGALGMLTTGRSLSKTMVAASCLAWQVPVRPRASVKLTGYIVGLMTGVALVAVLVNRVRAELGVAVTGMSFVVAIGLYTVAWGVVLAVVPRRSKDPASLLPGALLLALVLVGMQAVSQLYLPRRFDRASELYGAIGTTIVTLGWFFILGRAIVLAMAVNAAVFERFGTLSDVVSSLPGVRALVRRSPRLRRTLEPYRKAPEDDGPPVPPPPVPPPL
jgi:uncharacterized BrkB/YihY/UPF0761 family membrane protein